MRAPVVATFLVGSIALAQEGAIEEHLLPPELVMRHQDEIGLKEDQRLAIKRQIHDAEKRFLDLRWDLEAETEKMAKVLSASPIDEAKALAQLDAVMDREKEIKKAHLSMLLAVRKQLTSDQVARLMEIRKMHWKEKMEAHAHREEMERMEKMERERREMEQRP